MPILLESDYNIKLPEMTKVIQKFPDEKIEDVQSHVELILKSDEIDSKIMPGHKVALAVGSRGIGDIAVIVKTLADHIIAKGAEPFIVAAMGSHGAGTEKGRSSVLESLGITEDTMGIPVMPQLEVEKVGSLDGSEINSFDGDIYLYMDKNAYDADMTVLINRIKPHTDFDGEVESGLCKMSVIGLGNHIGCSAIHEAGFENFQKIIPKAARHIIDNTNIGFGIGVVENAYDRSAIIEAIPSDKILDREPELLKLAKKLMPKIMIPDIDILIIDEIGKDISGGGMDPNIVGRYGPKAESPLVPDIKMIIVLRLSEGTHGNASGIGLADVITKEVLEKIDFESTYANCFAVGDGYETAHIPLVMNDRHEAICAAIKMCKVTEPEKSRIVRIKNTLDLREIEVSEEIMEEIKDKSSFVRLTK